MITTTPVKSKRGFSLTELLVAMALSSMILTAVLSSVMLIIRSSYSITSYSELEGNARIFTEIFARDARQSYEIKGITSATDKNNIQQVTLTILKNNAPVDVRYVYDSPSKEFRRIEAGNITHTLNYVIDVKLTPFKIYDPTKSSNLAVSDLETDQLQLKLIARKTTAFQNTNTIISAKYILRNRNKLN